MAGANGRNGDGPRIEVRKTYKLYIGGAFPRSESGRSYLVSAADGSPLANAVRSSRKDLRDAVRAAHGASPGWSAKTAMNRGQVLYRVAELMEGRRAQFVAEVAAAEGLRDADHRQIAGEGVTEGAREVTWCVVVDDHARCPGIHCVLGLEGERAGQRGGRPAALDQRDVPGREAGPIRGEATRNGVRAGNCRRHFA